METEQAGTKGLALAVEDTAAANGKENRQETEDSKSFPGLNEEKNEKRAGSPA